MQPQLLRSNHASHGFCYRRLDDHRPPRFGLCMTLCLLLTVGPATFAPFSLQTPGSVCHAAPAPWMPAAETFGVVQLDLEGDPNCDYTTKIRIAGSEYNVIIDTGSAHFAIASNACQDCIIPHQDRYQPNEEEDIPIDADNEPMDRSSLRGSAINLFDEMLLLNLMGHSPKASYTSRITRSSTAPSRTIVPTMSTPPVSGSCIPDVPIPNRSPSRMSCNDDLKTRPCPTVSSHSTASILDSSTHASNHTLTTGVAPSTSTANIHSPAKPTPHSVNARASTDPVVHLRYHHNRRSERRLAAAPAENLYPLSNDSSRYGQAVRVGYGIKTHSVGWSGMMTFDQMSLEMARVNPMDVSSGRQVNESGTVLGDPANRTREKGLTRKETTVEFAAIMENNDFFSQECGAQHGIWGLGYKSLSVDQKPTLFDTLSASMKIPNGFALQLCGRQSNTTKTGNMFLGGYSTHHLAEPMQFVPLVKKDWYQVRLDGFKVMGEPVQGMQNLNVPKTIVDSGTTNVLMSHYNLQFLIQSLAQSSVVRWSDLIPEQDIYNFWYNNAVLRLPRSSFEVSTAARAVEVVISGVPIPIYASSFLRIRSIPVGQAPEGYVDFWWHGFASSTPPDAIEEEAASGGAVMAGSVGTILGETLFTGKVVYFERGSDDAQPGDPDFGRIGFGRGQNCFAPADATLIDILASGGKVASISNGADEHVDVVGPDPVRVVATSEASATKLTMGSLGHTAADKKQGSDTFSNDGGADNNIHQHAQPLSESIRLIGSAVHPFRLASGLLVVLVAYVL